jgi:hypothetical protein
MRVLTLLLATALTCLAKPVELEFPGLTERVLIELPDNYEHLFLAYLKLSDSAAGTRQGKIAALDHLRLEKLLKHYSENERLQEKEENPFGRPKTEAVKPNFPEIDRGIPRNPLIK